jgi:hypothetical protein
MLMLIAMRNGTVRLIEASHVVETITAGEEDDSRC